MASGSQYGLLSDQKRRDTPGTPPAPTAAPYQPYVAGKNAGTVNYRRGWFAGLCHGEIRVKDSEIIVITLLAAAPRRASSWRLVVAWTSR